jgi:hypothetical protein
LDPEVLARQAERRSKGNISAATRFIWDAHDEEATHAAWFEGVRNDWLTHGGRARAGNFHEFVKARALAVAHSVITAIKTLPAAAQANAKAAVAGSLRLYQSYPRGTSDAQIWKQLQADEKTGRTFVAEMIRQMSQHDRFGATTETRYLEHIDPEKFARLTRRLVTTRKMIKAGILGDALRRSIDSTNATMRSFEASLRGKNRAQGTADCGYSAQGAAAPTAHRISFISDITP